jgi:hypothetical protein
MSEAMQFAAFVAALSGTFFCGVHMGRTAWARESAEEIEIAKWRSALNEQAYPDWYRRARTVRDLSNVVHPTFHKAAPLLEGVAMED